MTQGKRALSPSAIALLCGILSFFVNPLLSQSALAIVFGLRGRAEGHRTGAATAGIVLGVLSGILSIAGGMYLASRGG